MADKEFNVLISAETDGFTKGVNEAEREASGLGETLDREVSQGAENASESLKETTEELRRLQREAMGSIGSIDNLSNSLDSNSNSSTSAGNSINNLSNEVNGLDGDMKNASNSIDGLNDNLDSVDSSTRNARDSISDLREELRGMQRDALGAKASVNGMGTSFSNTDKQTKKFNKEMQRLSMLLGGDVPESTKKAYKEMMQLHQEARKAQRTYGKYSSEALNARDAITNFALGLDDATFKQIYMRSQLGLTDMQIRRQANSIKLNARMTKLMGNQTKILTERMKGLAKHGIKPEMMLPPSTIGQFQLLNETMEAGRSPLNALSLGYRKLGGSVEKVIKNYSAQKVAIREAQGDMIKYGLLLRGITAANANMALAFPIVGLGAIYAYGAMFKAALNADESLKKLAETTKSKVLTALQPLINIAGQFLQVALNVVGAVSDWITKFNEAHPAIANILGVIGFLLPAMTLLLLPLQMGIGLWNGWMVALNGVWTMFGGVVTMIGTASATFLSFAAVIGVLVGAFIYLWQTNEGFKNACIVIWEAIKQTIQMALQSIQDFFVTHGDTIKQTIQTAYEFLKTIIETVLNAIKEIVTIVLDSIKDFWSKHGETVKQAVKTVYETIKSIISSLLDSIKIYVTTVLNAIKDFWSKHGDTLKRIVKTMWDLIKSLIKAALDIISSVINAVCSAINGDWDTFWNEVGNICRIIWESIKNIVKAGINAVPGIIRAAKGLVRSAIKGVLNGALNAAKSFGSKLLQVGKDLIKGLANGIKAGATWVKNAVSNTLKNAINAGKKLLGINSPSKLFRQFGEWTVEGYQIGVDRKEPSSTRAVEDFANNSINAFTTTALPTTSSNENNSADYSTYNININAGNLSNERDLYKLAEIIDKKLAEIKMNKSLSRGGGRVVY